MRELQGLSRAREREDLLSVEPSFQIRLINRQQSLTYCGVQPGSCSIQVEKRKGRSILPVEPSFQIHLINRQTKSTNCGVRPAMPSPLARRLLIVATVEGLLLTPIPANNSSTGNTPPKSRRSTPAPSRATSPSSSAQSGTVQIDYKTANIRKLPVASDEHRRREREGGLEVHGIAGKLCVLY